MLVSECIYLFSKTTAMRTKLLKFEWDEEFTQFIDKDEFMDWVNKGKIKIVTEYPNERIKLCKENGKLIRFELMDKDDWTIKVCKCNKDWFWKNYQVESNLGWFPVKCVTVKQVIWFYVCNEPRYRGVYADWIDWTELWGSRSMYADSNNWERRKMLVDNGFTVVDVDKLDD